METQKVYLIYARTGCTCCAYENFTEGPYTDKAEIEAIVADWRKGINSPLASQYAQYGVYDIEEHDAEVISGGRFIIGDDVWGPEIDRRVDGC